MVFDKFLGRTTPKDTTTSKSARPDVSQQETSKSQDKDGQTILKKMRERYGIRGDSTPGSSQRSLTASSSVESLKELRQQLAKAMQSTELGLEEVTAELKSLEEQEKQTEKIETLYKNAYQVFLDHLTKRVCNITGLQPEDLYAIEEIQDPGKAKMGISSKLEEKLAKFTIADTKKSKGIFEVDHKKLKVLSEYLKKDPTEIPAPSEGSPIILKDKDQIGTFLEQRPSEDSFDPKEALDLYSQVIKDGMLKLLYDKPLSLRGKEVLTLGGHTVDVGWRFETCCARWLDRRGNPDFEGVETFLSLKDWRKALQDHDAGKPLMQSAAQQNVAIFILGGELLRKTASNDTAAERILALYMIDIGEVYKQASGSSIRKKGRPGETADETKDRIADEMAKQIIATADRFNVSPLAVANSAVIYHMCDAGAYPNNRPWFPIEYDENNGLYKFTRDAIRQEGHNLLFRALADNMQKRSIQGVLDIQPTPKQASMKSRVKHALSRSTPAPDRVRKLIGDLQNTTGRLDGHINAHFSSLRSNEHTKGLCYKYDETLDAIIKQTQASCHDATKHYGEKVSEDGAKLSKEQITENRKKRHAAEEEFAVMHGRLSDMATDLEILGPRINVLTQLGREADLGKFKAEYDQVLDGYRSADLEGEQARKQFRMQFITWINQIPRSDS
jgi:hypothetical protein